MTNVSSAVPPHFQYCTPPILSINGAGEDSSISKSLNGYITSSYGSTSTFTVVELTKEYPVNEDGLPGINSPPSLIVFFIMVKCNKSPFIISQFPEMSITRLSSSAKLYLNIKVPSSEKM